MATASVVEDYIIKAIQRAEFEHLEEGGCAAWIPGFPGLIAVGADAKACMLDIWRRVDDWIQASVEEGLELPVLDGIDLSCEENRNYLASRRHKWSRRRGRFFETEEEFLTALSEEAAGDATHPRRSRATRSSAR